MFQNILGIVVATCLLNPVYPLTTSTKSFVISKQDYISKSQNYIDNENMETKEGIWVNVRLSFYTASVNECDATPDITASGTKIHIGTCAVPKLISFGTKILIPDIPLENKLYVAEDRGSKINTKNGVMNIDIYVESKAQARKLGVIRTKAKILK